MAGVRRIVLLGLSFSISVSVCMADLGSEKRSQAERALIFLLQNVSPPDAIAGTIVASPSRDQPNYFRHWVRDGAIVADLIVTLWDEATDPTARRHFEMTLWDYINLSRQQQVHILEPLFGHDGPPLADDWGRPQQDGPALRAITTIRFATRLLNEGRDLEVNESLIGRRDQIGIIEADLRSLILHGDYGYDIWEEVAGYHFYTRMVHRKALVMGASLATRLGMSSLAINCMHAARHLDEQLEEHWPEGAEFILATVRQNNGIQHKRLHLDSQVVMGVLHGESAKSFGLADDRVLATVLRIEKTFRDLYLINQTPGWVGLAIGRYPEDDWNGYTRGGRGNPWLITTEAFGEFYDRLGRQLVIQNSLTFTERSLPFFRELIPFHRDQLERGRQVDGSSPLFQSIVKALHLKADGYYDRVLTHLGVDGQFSEQFNRDTGYAQGPTRLTWSCAAFLAGSRAHATRPSF